MKKLLLTSVLGAGLVLPPNATIIAPPMISQVPPVSIQPQPQVAIIPVAIGVGVGIGVLGWAAVKVINGVLNIWEHQVTNEAPGKVDFTLDVYQYP